jgi:SAM-dependent methyltransferase
VDGAKALRVLHGIGRCPDCRSRLEWRSADARCTGCGRLFHGSDGVPVLLPTAGAPPAPSSATGARDILPTAVTRALERYRRFLRPSTTYKSSARSQLVDFVHSFGADSLVLNVGGGSRDYGPNVLNLEIEAMPGIGVVGVAEKLPFDDGSCDGVILQAVLEHVVDENDTLAECFRVLRPGGRVLVEIPFIQGDHPAPGDYRRYTEQGLRQIVERHGLQPQESGVAVGPASALAWVLAEFLALLVSVRSRRLYQVARLATTFVAWPVKFLDRVLDRHPMAHVIASGVWVVAVKP